MSLWLLNHFSTFTLTVVTVGGTVLLAVAGSVLARRRYPSLAEGEHNDMVGVTLGMFGAIYGIILAFVIVTLWTQLDNTQTIVATEATDVALIARDAAAFPAPVRADVDAALSGYVHAVVEDQWPRMRAGEPSYGATGEKLQTVFDALQAYEPKTAREEVFYEEAVGRLNDVAGQRRARLTMAEQELPRCSRSWPSAARSSSSPSPSCTACAVCASSCSSSPPWPVSSASACCWSSSSTAPSPASSA